MVLYINTEKLDHIDPLTSLNNLPIHLKFLFCALSLITSIILLSFTSVSVTMDQISIKRKLIFF